MCIITLIGELDCEVWLVVEAYLQISNFNVLTLLFLLILFQVTIEDVEVSGEIEVKVVMENAHHPPRIENNRVMPVNERGKVIVQREDLLITHPDMPPREMKYSITQQPVHGSLFLKGSPKGDVPRGFSQEDINNGRLVTCLKKKIQNRRSSIQVLTRPNVT